MMPAESLIATLLMATIVAAEPRPTEDLPAIELLEFLGTWETTLGEWIDPTSLTDETPVQEESQSDDKRE